MFPNTSELELAPEEMRRLVNLAMERIVNHIESLPHQPSWDVENAAVLAHSLIEKMPESGADFEDLLNLLFDQVVPKSFNTAGPGYLAYIPGGGIFHSALADLIADSVNRYVGVWLAAPALATLEANVLRWFCEIMGYPTEARGLLTTGGSMANFTAIVTARRNRLPENFLKGILYASDQVHHSIQKAAILAGFPPGNIREIPPDSSFRIRIDSLKSQIAADRDSGLEPFMVVANAGTTNTGAVDDLSGLADLVREENLWLHVDAAYGGFFMLTERGKQIMRGIDRSDSVTLDPHKGLFLPYGNGCVLVRDGEALKRAHSVHAEYMPPMQEDPDRVDFCLYSPELSRDARGLRAWLPLKMHGIRPFRENLDEKLDLAQWATGELRKIPGMEIVAEPQLSLVAFRIVRPGHSEGDLNSLNRSILDATNARRRVYLTSTMLDGRFVLRICVLSFRTHRDRVGEAIDDLRSAIAEF